MIVAGARLPSIPLLSTRGGTIDLSAHSGAAVVFVYPYTGQPGVADPPGWDDIPGAHGSTPQAQGFRDHYQAFRRAGYDVFGLSGQTPEWQQEAASRLALPFALLSDERLALADAAGLPRFKAGTREFLARLTLIIRDGIVQGIVHPVLNPAGHASSLIGCLDRST